MNSVLLASGLLLVAGFVAFAAAVSLPERGGISRRVWSVPHEEAGRNPRIWRWTNILFAAGAVPTSLGWTLLVLALHGLASRILAPAALLLFLMSNILWLIFSCYRATVTLWAAEHFLAQGETPASYGPLSAWADALGSAHLLLGYLAIGALGGALLETSLLPGWIGWFALVWGIALAAVMVVGRPRAGAQQGTIAHIPAWVQIPPFIIGVALLFTA